MSESLRRAKGLPARAWEAYEPQFSTPVNIQMSLYSVPFYAAFDERLGYPYGYRAQGYLFCATNDRHMAYLRTNYECQVRLGLKEARLITADDVHSMFPHLRSDDIVGGAFCSTDGFVDPYSAMIGFMSWAADHGAELWKNTLVTGIQRDGFPRAALDDGASCPIYRQVPLPESANVLPTSGTNSQS